VQLISLLYYKTEWSLSKLYYTNHYSAELMISTNSMVFASLRTNDKIEPMSINILDLHCIQISFRNWDTTLCLGYTFLYMAQVVHLSVISAIYILTNFNHLYGTHAIVWEHIVIRFVRLSVRPFVRRLSRFILCMQILWE
jgi:hypothetical protein